MAETCTGCEAELNQLPTFWRLAQMLEDSYVLGPAYCEDCAAKLVVLELPQTPEQGASHAGT